VYGYTSSEVKCHSSSHRCECNGERQRGITCSTCTISLLFQSLCST